MRHVAQIVVSAPRLAGLRAPQGLQHRGASLSEHPSAPWPAFAVSDAPPACRTAPVHALHARPSPAHGRLAPGFLRAMPSDRPSRYRTTCALQQMVPFIRAQGYAPTATMRAASRVPPSVLPAWTAESNELIRRQHRGRSSSCPLLFGLHALLPFHSSAVLGAVNRAAGRAGMADTQGNTAEPGKEQGDRVDGILPEDHARLVSWCMRARVFACLRLARRTHTSHASAGAGNDASFRACSPRGPLHL